MLPPVEVDPRGPEVNKGGNVFRETKLSAIPFSLPLSQCPAILNKAPTGKHHGRKELRKKQGDKDEEVLQTIIAGN